MSDPSFLTLDEVVGIHADQIRRYGGRPGIRDLSLLQSALGTPETTFGGDYLHTTVFEMAAAYLYHIARNHPFMDGNKRTGLMVSLVFLGLNGLGIQADSDELVELVAGVASGDVGKSSVAVYFEQHATHRDSA